MESSESIRPDSGSESDIQKYEFGRLIRYSISQNMILLFCVHGNLCITVPAPRIIRLTYFTGDEPNLTPSPAVNMPLMPKPLTLVDDPLESHTQCDSGATQQVNDGESTISLEKSTSVSQVNGLVFTAEDLRIEVMTNPFSISVYDEAGHYILREFRPYVTTQGKNGSIINAEPNTHFYGLGETTSYLDKRGERYTMWNSDVYAPHVPEIDALYVSIPFLITFDEKVANGLFLDNPGKSVFDMKRYRDNVYEVSTETGVFDIYLISGPAIKDVVCRYTEITGRMPMPPKWAIGYHQSRYSYMNQETVVDLVRTFREKQIPLDAVYLDIHYMDGYRVFTFDHERFPDPKRMTSQLRKMGVRVVPIVDPGVKQDPKYSIYREGVLNDYFCKSIEGEMFIGEVWPGRSAFPDFSDDRVTKWWGDKHSFYLDAGMSGIWNDMNEPAVFNDIKTMEPHIIHRNNGTPRTHGELHNLYGFLMSRATYEGLLNKLQGKRPFVLTRSAYSGTQRYAAVWTGDNRSFWEHMAMTMPMLLNMGLSGLSFAGSDVGGFAHDTSGELLVRWIQLGTFLPFFRNHSALNTRRQEPWQFGEDVEAICKKYISLRYQLMPYLYSLIRETVTSGLPFIRPLVLEYPEDGNTYSLCDQFLLGKDLLVAPIYRPDTDHRSVYLPKGTWINYWTGEQFSGCQHILVHAPIDTIPIFVRKGAIIPEAPIHQSTDELDVNSPIIFNVYTSIHNETNSFVWYEDDGQTMSYEAGAYNEVELSVTQKDDYLSVRSRVLHCGLQMNGKMATFRVHHGNGTVSEKVVHFPYDGEIVRL